MTKYFRNAFATGGDREAVPDQAVGTLVNYEKGYTPEYELDPDVDPAGNYVGRRRMNQLFNDITGNLKFWQENGVPEIVANDGTGNPLSYKKGFVGSYLGVIYRALVDDTATLPPSAEWSVFAFASDTELGSIVVRGGTGSADEGTFKIGAPTDPSHPVRLGDIHPSMTGSITLNGTTDNTVDMADIVTELDLEIGDVIRIDTGAYNKLHTVESITDNSSIIVNYEHAGNRGDGSLKLPAFTGQATVTRIAKWFNAPIGLGQAWVDVMSVRAKSVNYTNATVRCVLVSVTTSTFVGDISLTLTVDGKSLSSQYRGEIITTKANVSGMITGGAVYSVTLNAQSLEGWMELR